MNISDMPEDKIASNRGILGVLSSPRSRASQPPALESRSSSLSIKEPLSNVYKLPSPPRSMTSGPKALGSQLRSSPVKDPSSAAWSVEDDLQLMQARSGGQNWGPIASRYFPWKTPNACRKRHERLVEKQKSEKWDGIRFDDLAEAYAECRESMWRVLGERLGQKWSTVESKCMEKGLKNIYQAARSRSRRNRLPSSSPLNNSYHDNFFESWDSGICLDGPSDIDPDQYRLHKQSASKSNEVSANRGKPINPISEEARCTSLANPPGFQGSGDTTFPLAAASLGNKRKRHNSSTTLPPINLSDLEDTKAEDIELSHPYSSLTLANALPRLNTPTNSSTKRPKLRAKETSVNPSTPSRSERDMQYQNWSKSTGDTERSNVSSRPAPSTPGTGMTASDIELDVLNDNEVSEITTDFEFSDSESEQRMLDPKAYFSKLKNLEAEVFENSAVKYFKALDSNGSRYLLSQESASADRIYEDLFNYRITESQPGSAIDEEAVLQICRHFRWQELFHLLECRNLITRVCNSLKRLQGARFCGDFFSLLVQDRNRDRVTRLVSLQVSDIYRLEEVFKSSLSNIVNPKTINHPAHSTDNATLSAYPTISENHILHFHCQTEPVSSGCIAILSLLDLGDISFAQPPLIWRQTVHVLDLAILSYTGAHVERIDENHLGITTDSLQVLGPFARDLCLSTPQINMRRRRLECLDRFLGAREIWVFHSGSASISDEHLYLSTDAETLGDVWGPLWKSTRISDPNHIYEYNIGNGCIVPWNPDYNSDSSPKPSPRPSEVLCHWISFRHGETRDIDHGQHNLTKKFFTSTDTLLIGAECFGLRINNECFPSISRLEHLKTKFRERGSLRHPRTQRSRRYKDSHAIQIQGTALGIVSVADTITYKRRVGHSMKDTLVERWRYGSRNPLELEAFSGLEVSLCTQNARRRRLLQLLSLRTMRKYLKAISFAWNEEACETGYFKALRSPKSFRLFWKENRAWRKNIGDAISDCLDALQETGINDDTGELAALWVETFDEEGDSDGEGADKSDQEVIPPSTRALNSEISQECDFEAAEEWIVTLFRSEHTWTGFLQDSPDCLTMAVMEPTCLDLDDVAGYGRRCQAVRSCGDSKLVKWTLGYPVLETSILLNTDILKKEGLRCKKQGRRRYWDTAGLKKDSRFGLGDQGSLTVYSEGSPLIMDWDPVNSKTWQELKNSDFNETILGKNSERHHQEYIRGSCETSPLPILILSRSTKIRFHKG